MDKNATRAQRRRSSCARGERSRRLRPTVLALEGRALLSILLVNNTADEVTAGTLRWAVAQANADSQADTIDFSSLFNTPQTITLKGGPLLISNYSTTTIKGPGANLLTVSGNHASLVFDVVNGGSAALSGLTITGGNA